MGKQDWEQVDIFIRNRIRKPSSQSETRFLRGACLRLEQIAATQPIEIRKGAIKMLIFLSNNVDQKVKDVAQDVLKRLGEDNDSRSPGNQSVALASSDELYNYQANQDSLPPIWDPYWRSTSKSILLQREMERRNLPNLLQQICEKTQQTYDFAQASNETTLQLSEGQNVMMQQMSQVHNGQQTLTHQFHEVQQAVQHNQIGHQALAQQFQNGQQDIIQGQQTILREFMMHRLHNNRLVTQRRFQHIETHLISPSPYNQIEYNNSENQLANVNFYIEELKKAFNVYYTPNLVLKSISGEKSKINLDTCDIELAILSAPHQRGHDNSILEFHKETDKKKEPRQQGPSAICEKPKVQVKDLFTSKNENGEVHLLNKLLIQGRAGIGKTTLCKRIVYSHQKGMWTDKFDVVFWLPLRELKIYEARTLDKLLLEKYFPHNRYKDELVMIFRYLMAQGRVLFVLDGLDEIVIEAQIDANMPLKSFIVSLLEQSHVIVTARPSGVEMSILSGKLETELETVGFNEVNVEEYVKKFFPEDAKSAQDILNFIGSNEFLQTLVNVPVQLEVVCFGWSDLSKGPKVSKFSRPSTPQAPVPITVTGLYQAMVYKLLRKDIMQLGKALNGKPYGQAQTLSEQQVERLQPYQIDTIMEIEVTYLSYLSFTGLKDGYVIEFSETHLGETTMGLDDLRKYAGINEFLPFDLIDQLKQTSFLHSADTEMMEGRETLSDSWHFLHLTFQEFFAAKWIARHFGLKKSIPNSKAIVVMTPEEMTEFINTNKFNARYEIVWSMLAGLLAGMENGKLLLEEFFDMLEINDSKFKHDDRVRILEGCFREAKHKLAEDRIRRLEIEIGLNQREE
ncbi:hypothetical protein BGZ76_001180 [Entomortierella beljakovae]|nr:hypothetical protein BGZ76_001180 [Entomortierella beljakovae]